MKFFTRLTLVLMMTALILFAEDLRTILKNNMHLRQGPGCYYPLITVLNLGDTVDVISQSNGWAYVKYLDTTGYVYDKGFSENKKSVSTVENISPDGKPAEISKITAGGAVKGFATKYYKDNKSHKQMTFETYMNPNDYLSIKKSMEKNQLSHRKYNNLLAKTEDFHIDTRLDNIGNIVAGQIASDGLIYDRKQLSYLNCVGTLVLEQTDLYYYPIKFFIVNDDHKAAYATPNGMIFVTKGLLDFVEDEAELACLLGHEISHIIYQHGYEELQKRKVNIKADDAFAELDMEIDDEKSEEQLELEELAVKFYENSTAPRQMGYEYEADKMGVIYATKAGYDPYALTRLLSRLQKDSTIDYDNFESNWEKHYIKDRIDKVSRFIGHHLEPNNVRNRERYQSIF